MEGEEERILQKSENCTERWSGDDCGEEFVHKLCTLYVNRPAKVDSLRGRFEKNDEFSFFKVMSKKI